MSELFTRDGHLHELAIDRLLTDDLSTELLTELEAHLGDCAPCAERVAEARSFVAEPLPLRRQRPEPGAQVIAFPRRRVAAGVAVAFAMAAGLLLALKPPTEEFTARGGDLQLEVHRQEAKGTHQLQDGEAVFPGDHLGFRVSSRKSGFLMVLGVDQTGSTYPCYPQGEQPEALPLSPSRAPVDLNTAIQLDDAVGQEHIVALRCPEVFSFDEVSAALAGAPQQGPLPTLRAGCAQSELRLPKPGARP